jgi:hypothetical protein
LVFFKDNNFPAEIADQLHVFVRAEGSGRGEIRFGQSLLSHRASSLSGATTNLAHSFSSLSPPLHLSFNSFSVSNQLFSNNSSKFIRRYSVSCAESRSAKPRSSRMTVMVAGAVQTFPLSSCILAVAEAQP